MCCLVAFFNIELYAQFTITDKTEAKPKEFKEEYNAPSTTDFISKTPAWYKQQRKEMLQRKHFFETKTVMMFNQFAYVNWAAGGESSYTGNLTTLNTHSYTNKNLTIDSYLNASIGLGEKNGELWKTEDNIEINSIFNYLMWGKWSYSLGVNFNTQFAKGYGTIGEPYSSTFFAPATLKPFLGVSYRHSDTQIITIAPLSGNVLFVCDERLSNEGAYGVVPGRMTKTTMGSYINIQWTQPIDRKGILTYKTNAQVFFDYTSAPVVGWENWIDITLFKYFTVGVYLNVIYNNKITRQAGSDSFWQLKENLGIGVSYNFKSRDKKPDNSKYTKMVRFDY